MRDLRFHKIKVTSFLLLSFSIIMLSSSPKASDEPLKGQAWTVTKNFGKGKKAREGLSGVSCPTVWTSRNWCLAVNDEKNYAQFFSISEAEKTIKPTKTIRLLPKKDENGNAFGEIDAEAASYDNGYVYVTGSHGKTRKKCDTELSRYFLFRFPVKEASGKPTFKKYGRNVSEHIERSAALRDVIKSAKYVGGKYADQVCLDDGGTNIEGMEVVAGQVYLGFRAPSLKEHAFIMQLAAQDIFNNTALKPKMHRLKLGKGVGIRDLVEVKDGLLILTGASLASDEEKIPANVFFWNISTGQLKTIAQLPRPKGTKAETLLVLDETAKTKSVNYRVLVFYEGIANGSPTEFTFARTLHADLLQ